MKNRFLEIKRSVIVKKDGSVYGYYNPDFKPLYGQVLELYGQVLEADKIWPENAPHQIVELRGNFDRSLNARVTVTRSEIYKAAEETVKELETETECFVFPTQMLETLCDKLGL